MCIFYELEMGFMITKQLIDCFWVIDTIFVIKLVKKHWTALGSEEELRGYGKMFN